MFFSYQGLILKNLFFPISVSSLNIASLNIYIRLHRSECSSASLIKEKSSQPNRTGCLVLIAQIAALL
jgi:hypothetical protein